MSNVLENYTAKFISLKSIILTANEKILDGDEYFTLNINFFCNAFLISLCAHLESYLKDVANKRIESTKIALATISIPKNIIIWELNKRKEIKDSEFDFGDLSISINKTDIDDHISGHPYKTIKLFKRIGTDLESIAEFNEKKDQIAALVSKRNNVIHHDNSASETSLTDLVTAIDDLIIPYIGVIYEVSKNFILPENS